VRGGTYPCHFILLPPQNPRSPGTSPLGLTSLKRKNHPVVVTLGGIGSCYASLAFKPQAFILATNCAMTKPTTLQDAIWRTRDLGLAAKPKFVPRPPLNTGGRDQRPPMNPGGRDPRGFDRGRGRLDENTRRELRRKQLCFTCKEPWNPSHKCMGRGQVHYIEVTSNNEEEEDFDQIQNMEADTTETTEEETTGHDSTTEEKATLASISGVPKYNTFRMRGVLQRQKVSVLIDGGASHNFIDRYIPCMKLTLGRHELI
jgi:hypothetical protein